MPEIPLSIGSKLELLHRAFVLANFRILSRTLTHLSTYAYCCRILAVYTMYMTEAPRFSADVGYIYAIHCPRIIVVVYKLVMCNAVDTVLYVYKLLLSLVLTSASYRYI